MQDHDSRGYLDYLSDAPDADYARHIANMFAAARRAPAVGAARPREVASSPAPVQSLDPNIPPPPPLAEGSQRRASSVPSGVPRGTFIQSVLAMARGRPSGPAEVLETMQRIRTDE